MFTTDRPRLWLTLIGALMAFCCLGGAALSCLGGAITKEMTWWVRARKAVQASTVMPAQDRELVQKIRRLKKGERPAAGLLSSLAEAAKGMEKKTSGSWQALDRAEAPERLARMKSIARGGFASLETAWKDVEAAIQRRDPEEILGTLNRVDSLGQRLKDDLQTEMENLYGKEAPRIEPGGSDPARPKGE